MPPTREDDSNVPSALRKGAACLQCRKRKMRCDAGQPQCANCVKGKKDCQYASGRAKTKTQLLREKIQDLESKIRALEQSSGRPGSSGEDSSTSSPNNSADPDDLDFASPVSEFRAIPGPSGGNASASSSSRGVNSAAVSSLGDIEAPNNGAAPASVPTDLYNPDAFASLGGPALWGISSPLDSQLKWWERPEPPPDVRDFLVNLFLQRAEDFHFYLNQTRFRLSLDMPPPDCPHPSLMNAIFLLACHFTNTPEWTVHEAMFLARARESLLASLAHSDRLFDFLMASNLVAYYLYRTGRFLEGHHQTAGAARFAVSCGLHQIISPVLEDNQSEGAGGGSAASSSRGGAGGRASAPWSVSDMSVRRPGSMLTPPRDGLELGQRIIVFWQTYLLDKLGSAVTSLPGSLPDEADPLTEILTAWPRTLEEYERGDVRNDETATIRNLYEPLYGKTVRRRAETLLGLHAQATALHERASRLSPNYLTDTSDTGRSAFWSKFNVVQDAIGQFMTQLPPLHNSGYLGEVLPVTVGTIHPVIFSCHTMAHLSLIQLHNSLAHEIAASYECCLGAARDILRLAQLLTVEDYARMTMEVLLSYAWTICAQVLIRHLGNLRRQFKDETQVNHELDCMVAAMENLRISYPVVDFQLRKVADWRRAC